ncbi:MAG: DUF2310 family Zn-ribbon-containing protein [Eubacteriaceae bacterium]|nr:DUF2310 family Zn-ribbon-containing protein [Eubacteriaceae bacterium]
MSKFYKLKIDFIDETISDKSEFLFEFFAILYKNGQIHEDYNIVENAANYIAFVTTPESNSLDKQYNSKYLDDYSDKISITSEYIGNNLNTGEYCSCEQSSWYMLYTDYTKDESPLVCGDCGRQIPLYKVPYIMGTDEHFDIVSLQKVYRSIDRAWMYCLSDRFTKNQLSNPSSQLSKIAFKICNSLEDVLKKPVYYFLYQPQKLPKQCPKCGQEWQDSKRKETVDFICHNCRIAVDDPSN